jgi:hypothetical protein
VPLPALPPFEELRRRPAADLVRLYREYNRLDVGPAVACTRCGHRVPLPEAATRWRAGRGSTDACSSCRTTS